jgi:chromatin modification-related protein VID21
LVRAPVLDSTLTTGFIDLPAIETQLAVQNGDYLEDRALTLEEVFPDLTAYSGPIPFEEGQVPRYRLEEGHMPHHRPAHTSRIMDLEPIFVSTLQPAINVDDGKWDLHDGPWYDDPKGSTEITYDVLATSTSIFQGRTARVSGYHQSTIPEPSAHKLRPVLVWTPEEDATLQKLVGMYPFNWALIADSFNSEIVTIPTERRLPFDCFERWDMNFGPDSEKKKKVAAAEAAKVAAAAAAAAGPVPGSATTTNPGTEVNGAAATPSTNPAAPKPTASSSAVAIPTLPGQINAEAGPSDAPPPPGLSKREAKAAARNKYEGTKKAIRHQALYDSVRRLIRRRETTKQKTTSESKICERLVAELTYQVPSSRSSLYTTVILHT